MKGKEIVRKSKRFVKQNSPAILTGLSVAGTATLMFLNIYPKVKKILEEHRDEMDSIRVNEDDMGEEKAKILKNEAHAKAAKEIVKKSVPTLLIGGSSIACSIYAASESSRRIAAVSAAYEIASRSLYDYKEKIREIVPKKADEIKGAVIKKHVQEEDIPKESGIYSTSKGDVLCKDIYTKVYFRSSSDEIEKAINRMSARVRDESYITLSDLYYELGLKSDVIPPIANDIGWHDSDCIEGNLPITITTCWDNTGTVPVIGLDYEVDPFFKEGGRFRR